MRLGVGVTEPIRRHPLLIAQAMMTLSHLTRRAPILGIGAGERMNLDPYGFDPSEPVTRLDEALTDHPAVLLAARTNHPSAASTIGSTTPRWTSNPPLDGPRRSG